MIRALLDALRGKPEPAEATPLQASAAERPALTYAIGDVHGCLDQLRELEAKIVADAAGTPGEKRIVMLGDYVDRGPRSAGVLDHLLAAPPAGFSRLCLRGNHEQALLDSMRDPDALERWLTYGGDATMMSYGMGEAQIGQLWAGRASSRLQAMAAYVPDEHIAFISGLPGLFAMPGFIFVHAGLRPGVELGAQRPSDLLWIRDVFLRADHDFGAVVVHGHTPVDEPFVSPRRIGIDTGCFMTGRLTALRIDAAGDTRLMQVGPAR